MYEPRSQPPGRFCELFSRDSAAYARFRPRYPADLFAWLAALPRDRGLAWDCGTGTGQAATMLAEHFAYVIGNDVSLTQLRVATRAPGVGYVASAAELSGLGPRRVDLVTVAQAFHWLDRLRFYAEVDRVATPGAAVAIWGYSLLSVSPDIDALISHFHSVTVGPYWPAERRLVDEGYHGIEIPIEEVPAPPFRITAELSLPGLLGYLRTWSAVGNYLAAKGQDPVTALAPELASRWGDPEAARAVAWPLFVRAGRWVGPDRLGGRR